MPSLRLPQLRWPGRRKRRSRAPVRQPGRFELGRAAQPRPKRRLVPRLPWGRLALTALALAIIGGLGYGGFWLVDGPALRVQQITIEGADVADPLAIARSADIDKRSLLTLDTSAIAERVSEGVPAVRSASVRREWPQGVRISVSEHIGWGYWQSGGRRVVIDAAGLVIPAGRPPPEGAVTIFEIGATRPLEPWAVAEPDTITAVRQLIEDARSQRLGVAIQRFEFHADRGLVVRVADGPDAIFGDWRNYSFKVAAWGALLNRLEREPIEVNEIDLRFGAQLVVR